MRVLKRLHSYAMNKPKQVEKAAVYYLHESTKSIAQNIQIHASKSKMKKRKRNKVALHHSPLHTFSLCLDLDYSFQFIIYSSRVIAGSLWHLWNDSTVKESKLHSLTQPQGPHRKSLYVATSFGNSGLSSNPCTCFCGAFQEMGADLK